MLREFRKLPSMLNIFLPLISQLSLGLLQNIHFPVSYCHLVPKRFIHFHISYIVSEKASVDKKHRWQYKGKGNLAVSHSHSSFSFYLGSQFHCFLANKQKKLFKCFNALLRAKIRNIKPSLENEDRVLNRRGRLNKG